MNAADRTFHANGTCRHLWAAVIQQALDAWSWFWIGVELAFIQTYSWFHPTYLAVAIVVLGLAWLMNLTHPSAASPPKPELHDVHAHG